MEYYPSVKKIDIMKFFRQIDGARKKIIPSKVRHGMYYTYSMNTYGIYSLISGY